MGGNLRSLCLRCSYWAARSHTALTTRTTGASSTGVPIGAIWIPATHDAASASSERSPRLPDVWSHVVVPRRSHEPGLFRVEPSTTRPNPGRTCDSWPSVVTYGGDPYGKPWQLNCAGADPPERLTRGLVWRRDQP
jgi:hypothetical protein